MTVINNWKIWLLANLSLGLAPFLPEPHLFGKIRWIIGGATNMQPVDYFDLLLHSFPWILLTRAIFVSTLKRKQN